MEVIRVENLSKLYDLGQVGTGTLSKDLNRWWARLRGKEDPYARIGQQNNRTKKAGKDSSVWALKDINFSVNQGEVVGIIGHNGAGKSTLLKIISRITTPTTGSVKVKGRIASLLEVGTGFHPEMTGRENIFMNGTLLGMTRSEIQSKLDQIIDFAGVALYIDTPVKRYSSGMQVRLAFAVAAFLEPEILIVDEVLAVGDAEFQKKAIGRMQEVSKGDGRTVLFVSHNMLSIQKLCCTAISLSSGSVNKRGDTQSVVIEYINENLKANAIWENHSNTKNLSVGVIRAYTTDKNNVTTSSFLLGDIIKVILELNSHEETRHFIAAIGIKTADDYNIRTVYSDAIFLDKGVFRVIFNFDDIILASGTYLISIGTSTFQKPIEYFTGILSFNVSEMAIDNLDSRIIRNSNVGVILNPVYVEVIKENI